MSKPLCAGPDRDKVCALCGRPPGERCPKTPTTKTCPTCEGTGKVKS